MRFRQKQSERITTAAPVVVAPADIRAHWMKEGQTAPFDGLLLSEETYKGLREKIVRLEAAVAECRNRGTN